MQIKEKRCQSEKCDTITSEFKWRKRTERKFKGTTVKEIEKEESAFISKQ